MKLKIPPAIIAAVCAFFMWCISKFIPWAFLYFSAPLWLPASIAGIGGVFGLAGLVQFYIHKTSVDPHQPQKVGTLVRKGPYRFTRNPMYLALLLVLIAWGFYLEKGLTFLILPLFVWYMNQFQIMPEEKILEQKFGEGYRSYKQAVRRWI